MDAWVQIAIHGLEMVIILLGAAWKIGRLEGRIATLETLVQILVSRTGMAKAKVID